MDAGAGEITIRGSRLLLRALRPAEIDGQWVVYRITRREWQAR